MGKHHGTGVANPGASMMARELGSSGSDGGGFGQVSLYLNSIRYCSGIFKLSHSMTVLWSECFCSLRFILKSYSPYTSAPHPQINMMGPLRGDQAWGWSLVSRLSALIKEAPWSSLPHPLPCEDSVKIYNPEGGPLSTILAPLISDVSRTLRNKFLLFIRHSWCLVFWYSSLNWLRQGGLSPSYLGPAL